jgi:hypothetical protein
LAREDKAWLDAKAGREGKSMTEVVRSAIRGLRRAETGAHGDLESLLRRTRGCWRGGEGLSYQRRVRREWVARKRT